MRLQLQSFSVISHIIYGSAYIRNYLLLFFFLYFLFLACSVLVHTVNNVSCNYSPLDLKSVCIFFCFWGLVVFFGFVFLSGSFFYFYERNDDQGGIKERISSHCIFKVSIVTHWNLMQDDIDALCKMYFYNLALTQMKQPNDQPSTNPVSVGFLV